MAANNSLKAFVKDYRASLPGGLLRPAIFIPFGIYLNIALNHWNNIKKHHELHRGLYSSTIATGEKLAAKWGKFGFYWSFAVWIPSIFVPPPLNIVFGAIDALIAAYISVATNYQTGYVPHSIDHCKGSGAHDFQLPPGANESFFEAAARLNATATNPFQMCKSFVQEWQYGIAISSLFYLIALLNIALCLSVCIAKLRECRREHSSFWGWVLDGLTKTFQFTLGCFLIFYFIPLIFFRILPLSVKSRVRFARRWGVKAGLGVEQKVGMEMKVMKRKLGGENGKEKYIAKHPGEPANLADFLGIYDMLIMVVKNLHYVDIVNLKLVSRSVHEAVLPADAYAQRMIHFKMYTCRHSGKKQCWVCTNQTCRRCKHLRPLKRTTLYYHLDQCGLYCTKCYFKTVQKDPRPTPSGVNMDPRHCRCAPLTSTPNILQRLMISADCYLNDQARCVTVSRGICRDCNGLSDGELLQKREERTRWELKGGKRDGVDVGKCTGCEKVMGSGPRWWVCKGCNKECKSFVHVAWGKGEKRKKKEAVGEQAV